jgi:hypothetical protein
VPAAIGETVNHLARNLGIGCAVVLVVSVGSCVVSYQRYMHPRSIEPLPLGASLIVERNVGAPRTLKEISDPASLSAITERVNTQRDGWRPPFGENPLPLFTVEIVDQMGKWIASWQIGTGWLSARGLYKNVEPQELEQLERLIHDAPEGGVCRRRTNDLKLTNIPAWPLAKEVKSWCGSAGQGLVSSQTCGDTNVMTRTGDFGYGYDVFYFEPSTGAVIGVKNRVTTKEATCWGKIPTNLASCVEGESVDCLHERLHGGG